MQEVGEWRFVISNLSNSPTIPFLFCYKIFSAFSLKYSVCVHISSQERWLYQDSWYGLLHRKNEICMCLHFKHGEKSIEQACICHLIYSDGAASFRFIRYSPTNQLLGKGAKIALCHFCTLMTIWFAKCKLYCGPSIETEWPQAELGMNQSHGYIFQQWSLFSSVS